MNAYPTPVKKVKETKVKHSHQQGNLGSKERLYPAQKQQNTKVSVSYQEENNKPHSVHIRKQCFKLLMSISSVI
jgi:hypothetical protein